MFRGRLFAVSVVAAICAAALALSGCAFIKPGSLSLSQPQGIGSVRVHFALCTIGGTQICGPGTETATIQYVMGIAVPPGSTPPATFTAAPVNGGPTIVFTRNEEVASEIAASSVAQQKLLSQAKTPEEIEEVEELKQVIGGLWPPSGMQGVGYLSSPIQEIKNQSLEWAVDADFGLPTGANGGPFAGPFSAAIAIGLRQVTGAFPASRSVHCVRLEPEAAPQESDAFCSGSVQQMQLGTADLRIAAPAKPAQAFVGGSGQLSFPLQFANTGTSIPTFALSATTTAPSSKVRLAPTSFTPGTVDPTTHQATGTGGVTVTVPRAIKPGTYEVTLIAKTPQGGTATQVGKLKVTKPKLKFGGAKLNRAKGIANLKVKVPSGGRLTIAGKGVTPVKKKAKKAKTLTVKVAPTGSASDRLDQTGSAKVRVKATFKPTSGISVSKSRSIVLRLR